MSIGASFTTSFSQFKNYNSKPIVKNQSSKITFEGNLENATEMHLKQILDFAKKIDGKDLNEIVKKDLEGLLNNGQRVLKYYEAIDSLYKHRLVLGKSGLNSNNNVRTTFVRTASHSGEVRGAGNSILEAIENLIKMAKKGTLHDW